MSPFKSSRQRAYLYAHKPALAREFEANKNGPAPRKRRRRKRGALSGKARS